MSPSRKSSLPLAPHLSVAQHWVSSLHGRHGQRQTFQSPQQAAEVIVATHRSCQGLLTRAGGLRGKRKTGGHDLSEEPDHLGYSHGSGCCCRARGPPGGRSGKCSLPKVGLSTPIRTPQIQPHRLLTLQSLALTQALNQGPYLFQALNQCIQEAPRIVDTGIWDVSMARKGAQAQCGHWGPCRELLDVGCSPQKLGPDPPKRLPGPWLPPRIQMLTLTVLRDE